MSFIELHLLPTRDSEKVRFLELIVNNLTLVFSSVNSGFLAELHGRIQYLYQRLKVLIKLRRYPE